jgi:hypothetical protein
MRNSFGRPLALAASLLVLAGSRAQAQQLPPAAQVVDRYLTAIGGREALARLSSRHVSGEMSMPTMGMTLQLEMYTARPGKMFTRLDMGGMVITSGVADSVAWANSPMTGPKILAGAELTQALLNADFDNRFDFTKLFTTMENTGPRTVAGRACWNLRMVSTSGVEVQNCFDQETGLLIGSTAKQQTEMGEVEASFVMEDYRDFDGVKMPAKTTMTLGPQTLVTTIKTVSHAAIPDSIFALPAEIRALRH